MGDDGNDVPRRRRDAPPAAREDATFSMLDTDMGCFEQALQPEPRWVRVLLDRQRTAGPVTSAACGWKDLVPYRGCRPSALPLRTGAETFLFAPPAACIHAMPPSAPLPTSSRPLRFFHRGRVVEVTAAAPTRSVLDWLREEAHCTGTKEGCNEGDCGACTVVIGEPATPDDPGAVRGLSLRTVNACIRFLPTLDGLALFTVEDLKTMAPTDPTAPSIPSRPAGARPPAASLHPVQQAMVDCHGSQCGFCTPGFVMSLWSMYERCHAAALVPTRQQLADELAGNLCRCTGYRPILDAGQRMFDLPAAVLDTAPVLEALRRIRADADLLHLGPAAPIAATAPPIGPGDTAATRAPTTTDTIAKAGAPARVRFEAPTTLDAFAALRVERPGARILAGATDIGVWVNKQFKSLDDILYLGRVDALRRIGVDGDALSIGAGASLEAAFAALAARAPALADAWLRFASPPIRNAGTLGGNVANGSPIGDAPPCLMALDAVLELRRGSAVRRLPLDDFYLDYMTNRLEPGEFLLTIRVPLAAFTRQVRGYKLSKRFDSDISAVFGGFAIALDDAGRVTSVRLAFGGMAAVARRAAAAEAAIVGQPWTEATAQAAQAALAADFTPLSDMRASAGYRLQVAQNLVRRFWLETRVVDPLPASATSVWSGMPHRPLHGAAA